MSRFIMQTHALDANHRVESEECNRHHAADPYIYITVCSCAR